MNDHEKETVKLADSVERIHLVIPTTPTSDSDFEDRITDRLVAGCLCGGID